MRLQSIGPERTKMLVPDPTPLRIPKIVGTKNGTFTNPPSTRYAQLYRWPVSLHSNSIEFRSLRPTHSTSNPYLLNAFPKMKCRLDSRNFGPQSYCNSHFAEASDRYTHESLEHLVDDHGRTLY
jgi:hypothetical protein